MSYQIGKFATLLGVTPDWLKYYEKLNIVSPNINSSGFRNYSFEQASYVLFCIQLKNMNFNNQQIKEFLSEGSFTNYVSAVSKIRSDINKQYVFNEALIAYCKSLEEASLFFKTPDTWNIITMKGFYFLPFSNINTFIEDSETLERMREWTKFLPVITQTQKIIIPDDYDKKNYSDPAKSQWGLSVQKEFAEQMGLNITPPAIFISPRRCIEFYCKTEMDKTVNVNQGWPGTTKNNPIPDVLKILDKHNFHIAGDCYSKRILKITEFRNRINYNILYVPID